MLEKNLGHSSPANHTPSQRQLFFVVITILLSLWGGIVLFISPVGEFMINDDWCFVRIVETLLDGKNVTATGWGDGGPSVLCHILWGLLFSTCFGFSVTTLRISVLILAIGSSFALLLLLRQMKNSLWLSLLATLVLISNPLFLSQSFTFMSDITFLFLLISSFLLLHKGIEEHSHILLISGLFFALFSILTRQIGIVIPLGFLITCFLHPRGKDLNKKKMLLLTFGITIIPWILYEVFLWQSGSTPITSHSVFKKIFSAPQSKGFPDYLFFLFSQAGIVLMYTGFLLSPLVVLYHNKLLGWEKKRRIFILLLSSFVLFEACLMGGLINPPINFHRNVIYDFGIGPLLLKDIYLLDIQRTISLPKPFFFLLAFVALLSAMILLLFSLISVKCLFSTDREKPNHDTCFTSSFALICAFIYAGIILLTGFHDRYLIPLCALLLIWFTKQITVTKTKPTFLQIILSTAILLFLAGTSIFGVKDFMSAKRSLHQAHSYLLHDIQVNPCEIDGGFEFNGYFCSDTNTIDYNRKKHSWWWVNEEKYLITLGPLPHYQVVKEFPFSRFIGNDGSIHILRPD